MVVLIIFPVILQTDINVIMLSTGGQGGNRLELKWRYSKHHSTIWFITNCRKNQPQQKSALFQQFQKNDFIKPNSWV